MRYDINIALVVSVEAFDEEEAADLAERLCSRIEAEAEWSASADLIGPPPLAIVEGVTPVDD